MKRVHTRIGKDSDVFIYTVDKSGYFCILGAVKFKSQFINDASAVSLLQFLKKQRGKHTVKVPLAFMDTIEAEAESARSVNKLPNWMN